MKGPSKILRSPALQTLVYTVAVVGLMALSILQIYQIWARLDTPGRRQNVPGFAEPDADATLLEPFEMYITLDGQRFSRLTELSGHYQAFWKRTDRLLDAGRGQYPEAEAIKEADLPQGSILVLRYACPLEETAVREIFGVELAGCGIREILIEPAASRQDHPVLYLVDPANDRFYRMESPVTYTASSCRAFNESFWTLADDLPADYINAHRYFPERFGSGTYLLEREETEVRYLPSVSKAFVTDDGLDTEGAKAYAMHFFQHPDVAKAVNTSDSFIWYADEKRTVRYESNGLLQYVATQEASEKEPVSLEEAFRLASGFLQEDLRCDGTLLQEVYVCGYRVEEGTYTFLWNYAYNHIPFSMSEETGLWSGLEAPIEIIVEGSQVRYYHRYLLEKHMEADGVFTVSGSYIEALDTLLAEQESGLIEDFFLEYREEKGSLALYWSLVEDGGMRSLRAGEVRI